MEILEDINLGTLYIDPTEKFMDEYVGTAVEMKGYLKPMILMQLKKTFNK